MKLKFPGQIYVIARPDDSFEMHEYLVDALSKSGRVVAVYNLVKTREGKLAVQWADEEAKVGG